MIQLSDQWKEIEINILLLLILKILMDARNRLINIQDNCENDSTWHGKAISNRTFALLAKRSATMRTTLKREVGLPRLFETYTSNLSKS